MNVASHLNQCVFALAFLSIVLCKKLSFDDKLALNDATSVRLVRYATMFLLMEYRLNECYLCDSLSSYD